MDMTDELVHLGFTGTRKGMTEPQRKLLNLVLELSTDSMTMVHHGSCVGADEQVHSICFTRGLRRAVHPPTNEKLMANCPTDEELGDVRFEPKPYLTRNQDIVNASYMLIACPYNKNQHDQGGTGYTIRYAQSVHKPVLGIFPDGSFDWL